MIVHNLKLKMLQAEEFTAHIIYDAASTVPVSHSNSHYSGAIK